MLANIDKGVSHDKEKLSGVVLKKIEQQVVMDVDDASSCFDQQQPHHILHHPDEISQTQAGDVIIRHFNSFPTLPSNDSLNSLLSQGTHSIVTDPGSVATAENIIDQKTSTEFGVQENEEYDITEKDESPLHPTGTNDHSVHKPFDFGKYIEKENGVDDEDFYEDEIRGSEQDLASGLALSPLQGANDLLVDDWDQDIDDSLPTTVISNNTHPHRTPQGPQQQSNSSIHIHTSITPLSSNSDHRRGTHSSSSSRNHSRRPSLADDWGHPNVFAFKPSPSGASTPAGSLKPSRSFRYMASPVPSSNASMLGASDLDEDEFGNVLERRRQLLLLEDVDEDDRFDDLEFPEDMNDLHVVSSSDPIPDSDSPDNAIHFHQQVSRTSRTSKLASIPSTPSMDDIQRISRHSHHYEPKLLNSNIRPSSSSTSISGQNETPMSPSTPHFSSARKKPAATARYAQHTASSFAKTQKFSKDHSLTDSILQQYSENNVQNGDSLMRDDVSEISVTVEIPDAESLLKRLQMATQQRLSQIQQKGNTKKNSSGNSASLSREKSMTNVKHGPGARGTETPGTKSASGTRPSSASASSSTYKRDQTQNNPATSHNSTSRSSSRLKGRKDSTPASKTPTHSRPTSTSATPTPPTITTSSTANANHASSRMRSLPKAREHVGLSRRSLATTLSTTTKRPSSVHHSHSSSHAQSATTSSGINNSLTKPPSSKQMSSNAKLVSSSSSTHSLSHTKSSKMTRPKQLSHVALSTLSSCLKGSNILKAPLSRGYEGDGTELDGLEDLPVPPAAEPTPHVTSSTTRSSLLHKSASAFRPTGSSYSPSMGHKGHNLIMENTTKSAISTKDRDRSSKPHGVGSTALTSSSLQSKKGPHVISSTKSPLSYEPGQDTHKTLHASPGVTSSSMTRSASNRNLLSRKQSLPEKKKKSVPTLIRNLGAASIPKNSNGMVFNPSLQKWEGNEEDLRAFEQLTAQKPTARPSLIPKWQGAPGIHSSLHNSTGNIVREGLSVSHMDTDTAEMIQKLSLETHSTTDVSQASLLSGPIPEKIGQMQFDPVKMCWVGNEEEEEADIFADIEDIQASTADRGADAFELTKELQESLYIAEAEHKLFIGEWFPRVLQDSKIAAIRETSKSHLYELRTLLQYDPSLFNCQA